MESSENDLIHSNNELVNVKTENIGLRMRALSKNALFSEKVKYMNKIT